MAGRNDYRSTSFGAALRYQGRSGMWTWMLHRVTGLGILFFLILHVADTALVVYRPDLYDHALTLYKHPLFRVGEVAIFFSVVYHALNGLRIVVQDFWPVAMRHQKKLALTAAVATLVIFLPAAWMMLAPIVGLADEPGAERHQQRMEASPTAEPHGPVTLEAGR
jgi:succinate dehydrogenase / fumarate reductase, cytochrome b subunit